MEPTPLPARAADNIRFIRDTMERASRFTAVPGTGVAAMGATALVAAALSLLTKTSEQWLGVWLAEACLAVAIGVWTMARKARRTQTDLFSGPARRFLLGLTPPLGAAAILTLALERMGQFTLLPGIWLLLYGASIAVAGTLSIRIVQVMGVLFMALGAASFIAPPQYGDAFMAAGFGGLHIVFGVIIARKHGG